MTTEHEPEREPTEVRHAGAATNPDGWPEVPDAEVRTYHPRYWYDPHRGWVSTTPAEGEES